MDTDHPITLLADIPPAVWTVGLSIVAAVVSSRLTWHWAQRSWRHGERYEAIVGVLTEARRRERLTSEWVRLRSKLNESEARIRTLRGPRDRVQLVKAQRFEQIALSKIDRVNDESLDTVIGVSAAATKLRLFNFQELADLADNIATACEEIDRAREAEVDLQAARQQLKVAEDAFVEAARKVLRSGRRA